MTVDSSSYGQITPEGVDRLRSRLGVYYHGIRHVGEISADAIRTYAEGMGERNHIYLDEEFGRRSPYGSMIATPLFLWTVRAPTATNLGGMPGVHSFYGGSEWEFFRPVKPGDIISASYRPYDVVEKSSTYAGHMAIQYAQTLYVDQRAGAVARAKAWSIRTERKAARERDTFRGVQKPKYTPEDLEAIWEGYDREEIRESSPRYWEDVGEGEALPPIVRGPLRVVEIIFGAGRFDAFNLGVGASPGGNHYYRWSSYRKHLGFAEPDPETGVPDHPHRGHWEEAMAKVIALPGIYDLGPQRGSWLAQIVTNWMGDHGFVRKVFHELRRFNIEGDTTWVQGKVSRKWVEGDLNLVECETSCRNQRDETTGMGRVEVVLPSRARAGVGP
jgi:acyl dehydratase